MNNDKNIHQNDPYHSTKTNKPLYKTLNVLDIFAKEILHDLSSTFCNIYFGHEVLAMQKSDEVQNTINQSLDTFRKQIECYKSLFSHNYEKTQIAINDYFATENIKIKWVDVLDDENKINLEELWLPIFLLFLKKKFIRNGAMIIQKLTKNNKLSIRISISKIITLNDAEVRFLSQTDQKSDSSFLTIFHMLLTQEKLNITFDEHRECTFIEIFR